MEKKKLLPILILISLFISFPVKSNDFQNEALKMSQESEEKKLLYLEEAHALKENSLNKIETLLKPSNLKAESNTCNKKITEENLDEEYLIFISFSMPANSIKSLYQEAKENNAALVLRGLKNNSFKETGEYLKALGVEIQINPELFKQYQIQKVPTFTWIKKNEYHSLNGNVSFKFAKQKFQAIEP